MINLDMLKIYTTIISPSEIAITNEEICAYAERGIEMSEGKTLIGIDIEIDGEYVNIHYHYAKLFERIRRITGYLTGTVDRWNNAKKSELNDRVKHAKME